MLVRDRRGFTLPEVLVAAAIVVTSALAFSYSLKTFGQARQRAATIIAAATVGEVMQASYEEAERAANQTADSFSNKTSLTFPLISANIPAGSVNIKLTNAATEEQCFTINLNGCDCATFGVNCPVRVFTRMETIFDKTVNENRKKWAYRIEVSEAAAKMPAIGSSTEGANSGGGVSGKNTIGDGKFNERDFSQEVGITNRGAELKDSCNPVTDIGAVGMEKKSGKLICIRKPDITNTAELCPVGTVPKSFSIIPKLYPTGNKDDTGSEIILSVPDRVQFTCSPKFNTINCPDANYALNSVNLQTLEPGTPKSGTCTYITRELAVYSSIGGELNAGYLSGTVCPKNYHSVSTCSVITTEDTPGSCHQYAGKANSVAYMKKDPTDTTYAAEGRAQAELSCTDTWTSYYWLDTLATVPAPKNFNAITTNSGRDVSCQVNIPPQVCSPTMGYGGVTASSWQAKLQINVKCELDAAFVGLKPVN